MDQSRTDSYDGGRSVRADPPVASAIPPPRSPAPSVWFDTLKNRSGLVRGCGWAFVLASVIPISPGTLTASDRVGEETRPIAPEHLRFFESKIRPLLVSRCYECHSSERDQSEGGLQLDTAAAVHRGGDSGTLLVPGKPEQSLLWRAIEYRDSRLQMPPSGKLSEEELGLIRRWIELGAPDPRSQADDDASPRERSPLQRNPESHWAFRAPRLSTPTGPVDHRSRDVIDHFAAQSAAEAGLQISPPADSEVLIRRLYFDLTGLVPTRSQIERFVDDRDPQAYRRLVDELLASPAFGHRFGRHWLDVARYADTVGYALAGQKRRFEGSEKYRDWTIRAFCEDMPYDEMIRHQIAGDRTDPENRRGNLDAMGFLTLGRRFLNQLDVIDDRVDVITRGLLGMTVSCARCHDHKFDPIPTADYYSLAGIIFSSEQPKEGASPLMMVDKAKPIDSPILIRGQIGNRGPIAPRQFLTALRTEDEPRFTDGSGRWELAQRITRRDNPLTARVMVNRLWGHLIGKPLVTSPSDFGFRTQPPAVDGVLDDLSASFANHWSVKRTVRRIVLSRIYRQSAQSSDRALTVDPDNRLLARANLRRRDFESLRDSTLQVAGHLDRRVGGKSVEISLDTPSSRRTVYAMVDRQNLPSLFRTFDFANPDAHSPQRYFTTVPQQALFLLNGRQILELSRRASDRARSSAASADPTGLANELFQQILGRRPTEHERSQCVEFLKTPVDPFKPRLDQRTHWTYGVAAIDAKHSPSRFQRFGVFRDGQWQTAESFPAPAPAGHAFLGSEDGHTPHDTSTAVVRRFTAPFDGRVEIRGQMGHRNDQGDGVVTSIWVGGNRVFKATQKKNNRPYGPLSGSVRAGQTVDLVASAGSHDSFDSFYWRAKIRLVGPSETLEADSKKHFSGPFDPVSGRPLDRLGQLAQTLLMSNEFAFID